MSLSSDFKDRVAVVTGGGSGIGLACARMIAERGGKVAILGIDTQELEQSAAAARADGLELRAYPTDVSSEAEVDVAVTAIVAEMGLPRVLINSAAIHPYGTVETFSPAEWDAVINVNLRGAYMTGHFIVPHMRKAGGGAIVNIASVQGIATQPTVAAYSTSKGGLLALTRAMAVDFAPDGIRANTVCPGLIDAPMTRMAAKRAAGDGDPEALLAIWAAAQPAKRMGQPEEIAEVVAFLASDRASFVTAAEFKVDGGLLAQLGIVLPD